MLFSSVFDLAAKISKGSWPDSISSDIHAFRRIYTVSTVNTTPCKPSPVLVAKYNAPASQTVVTVSDNVLPLQVFFNKARGNKPQNFKSQDTDPVDPTNNGANCDFCKWQTLTAEDDWGRIELQTCVTASNLFKYNGQHGLVIFKHHDPLTFTQESISDALEASRLWFRQAMEADRQAKYPLLLWNCLPRAGASQFHGHAQTVVSREPCPTQVLLDRASEHYAAAHSGAEYLEDVVRAHRSIGLARRVSVGQSVAWLVASVCPYKDMEVFVTGSWLSEPAVAVLLHLALQALVGRLGMRTFNVGALNLGMPGALEPGGAAGGSAPVWVRLCSRGKLSVQASDFGGLEVFGGASIGHTDPFAVMAAIDAEAEALEVTLDQGGMLRHDLFGPGA